MWLNQQASNFEQEISELESQILSEAKAAKELNRLQAGVKLIKLFFFVVTMSETKYVLLRANPGWFFFIYFYSLYC
jgi:hypothetical protein